jgi:hypothetical protein
VDDQLRLLGMGTLDIGMGAHGNPKGHRFNRHTSSTPKRRRVFRLATDIDGGFGTTLSPLLSLIAPAPVPDQRNLDLSYPYREFGSLSNPPCRGAKSLNVFAINSRTANRGVFCRLERFQAAILPLARLHSKP